MHFLQGKGKNFPFPLTSILIVLVILIFGRKKQEDSAQQEKVAGSSFEKASFPVPDSLRKSVTEGDMGRARDRLRLASLERDILGDALTKIYDAEARGQINESEKNQLVQRYKVDLKRVDGEIDVHKRVVDLHELESAKEDLLKSFYEKLMEIDLRIGQLKPGLDSLGLGIEAKPTKPSTPGPAIKQEEAPAATTSATGGEKEKPQTRERPKTKAEERLDAVREEVLKAMERLEQIETEG
jgi:hypothetical protein